MASEKIDLPDLDAHQAWGVRLAASLRQGDVICLSGELGVGKTSLARAMIGELSGETDIPSPSFTIVQTYVAKGVMAGLEIWHVDLFRIQDPSEIVELGLLDAFHDALCLIEWPERLGPYLPESRLEIALGFAQSEPPQTGTAQIALAQNGRIAHCRGYGIWQQRLADLGADLGLKP